MMSMPAIRRLTWQFLAILLPIVLAGCALLPQTTEERSTVSPVLQTPTAIMPVPMPVPLESAPAMATEDLVVLKIPNGQPFSGKEGDPRPDWLGWGAAAFAIAPDGSFWIADTAAQPDRLLHYSPRGDLLRTTPVDPAVLGVYDMLVTAEAIWLLDIVPQPARLHRLGLDGSLQLSADIPEALMTREECYIANGIYTLWPGEDKSLLSGGVNGLHRLLDLQGRVVAEPLAALPFYGHTYGVAPLSDGSRMNLVVDGAGIEVDPPGYVAAESYLGFNPDGSFAVAVDQISFAAREIQLEQLVYAFAADGARQGITRRLPNFILQDFNHDLAFGLDGQIYQLISNPDHSVQIVRLGFSQEEPPLLEATPTPSPVPLPPLLPTWTVVPPGASDESQARETLLTFFTLLAEGRYAEGGALFGGDYASTVYGPPGDDLAAWWQTACSSMGCRPAAGITEAAQTGPQEYTFYVEFLAGDGTVLRQGACCGGSPAEQPEVWQFAYPVRNIDGQWKVMRTPLWTP